MIREASCPVVGWSLVRGGHFSKPKRELSRLFGFGLLRASREIQSCLVGGRVRGGNVMLSYAMWQWLWPSFSLELGGVVTPDIIVGYNESAAGECL